MDQDPATIDGGKKKVKHKAQTSPIMSRWFDQNPRKKY